MGCAELWTLLGHATLDWTGLCTWGSWDHCRRKKLPLYGRRASRTRWAAPFTTPHSGHYHSALPCLAAAPQAWYLLDGSGRHHAPPCFAEIMGQAFAALGGVAGRYHGQPSGLGGRAGQSICLGRTGLHHTLPTPALHMPAVPSCQATRTLAPPPNWCLRPLTCYQGRGCFTGLPNQQATQALAAGTQDFVVSGNLAER